MVSLLLVGICWAHSYRFIQLVARLACKVLKGLDANCGLRYLSCSSCGPSLTTGEPEIPYRMVGSKRNILEGQDPVGKCLSNLCLPHSWLMFIDQSKSHGQTQKQCGKESLWRERTGRHDQRGTSVTVHHILLCGRAIDSFRELDENALNGGIHS